MPDNQSDVTPAGADLLVRTLPGVLLRATRTHGVSTEDVVRLQTALGQQLAPLAEQAKCTSAKSATSDDIGFITVRPSPDGRFQPKVIQLKLSPLVAAICGAAGTALGPLSPLGWALIATTVALGLRDFWSKRVEFAAEHGQIMYEMFISTDRGKSHLIAPDHLFANVQASRVAARQPPLPLERFEAVLASLLATGALSRAPDGVSLCWTELSIELDI